MYENIISNVRMQLVFTFDGWMFHNLGWNTAGSPAINFQLPVSVDDRVACVYDAKQLNQAHIYMINMIPFGMLYYR